MAPRLDFLTDVPIAQITRAFNVAFGDYYLRTGEKSETWLANRMTKNAVDLDCSVGVFEGDELVAFSLTGIDEWRAGRAAFDAATGIVPAFRGRGIARRMFDFAIPRLVDRGVGRFVLEVLQVNEPAIKAYRRIGFRVTREFDCYEWGGEVGPRRTRDGGTVRALARDRVGELAGQCDWNPSWENSFASIARIPDELVAFGAFSPDRLVGTLVYYPLLEWIVSLVVHRDHRRVGVGSDLLSRLLEELGDVGRVKLVNVEHEDRGMTAFLERHGFRLYASQYEMEMLLRDRPA